MNLLIGAYSISRCSGAVVAAGDSSRSKGRERAQGKSYTKTAQIAVVINVFTCEDGHVCRSWSSLCTRDLLLVSRMHGTTCCICSDPTRKLLLLHHTYRLARHRSQKPGEEQLISLLALGPTSFPATAGRILEEWYRCASTHT